MHTPEALAQGLGHRCPACGAAVERIHRHRIDHLAGLFRSVHRYRCTHAACQWEGLLHRLSVDPQGHAWRLRLLWGAVGAAIALAGVQGWRWAKRERAMQHPSQVATGGAELQSQATPAGQSFDGEALPTHDERVLGNRTPLALRNSCAWGVPGGNPYRGTVTQALYAAQLPPEVVRQIAERAEHGWTTEQVAITRDGIRSLDGRNQWGPQLLAMAFGSTMCFNTRVNFTPGHVEHAALYRAEDRQGRRYTVIVPYVCQNVAVLGERGGFENGHRVPEPPAAALALLALLAAAGLRRRGRAPR